LNKFQIIITKDRRCDKILHVFAVSGAVRTVAVSPNSKFFASGSYDKTARIWRTCVGETIHVLTGHMKSVEVVTFSHDSSQLCSGSWDRTAILWDVEVGVSADIQSSCHVFASDWFIRKVFEVCVVH
jgi:WD40 repeat protein